MANKKIKGISVAIGGDTTDLQKELKKIDNASKTTQKELRKIESALKYNPENVILLTQKQELLTEQVQNTKTKLEQLESVREDVEKKAKNGDIGAEQYREYQREVEITKSTLANFEKKLSETQTKIKEAETKINSTDLQPLQNEFSDTQAKAQTAEQKINSTNLQPLKNEFSQAGKSGKDFAGDINGINFDKFKNEVDDVKKAAGELKDDLKDTAAQIGAGLAGAGATAVAAIKSYDSVESALNHIQAQTGLTDAAMQQYDETIQSIYKNNLGEDMTDIANVMSAIVQYTKETDPTKLQATTESAITLRDVFDFDIAETLRASEMLITQFGISGEEAFNLIVQGAQNGLNKNGDLLDTINEYGVHYKQLGYTAEEFINSLSNGTAAGTFSVDKLGDAMKEFDIRTKDTATTTVEAFTLLGYSAQASSEDIQKAKDEISELEKNLEYAKLEQESFNESTSELTKQKNADKIAEYSEQLENAKNKLAELTNNTDGSKKSMEELQAKFAAGGDKAKEATQEILEQLFAIDDKVLQNQIGVDLFGTMWEDLGIDGVKALTNVKGSADKTVKSMEKIKDIEYDDVTNSISGLGRQFQTDVVNKMIKKYYPQIKGGIKWTSEHLDDFVPIIKSVTKEVAVLYSANKANTVAKDVSQLISTYKALRTATDSAKTAQELLNVAQNTNVIGIIIGAVGTLINIYQYLFDTQDEAKTITDELNEKYIEHKAYLDEISEGYNNWKSAKEETVTETNNEFKYYSDLWIELQKIVDENGKIKEGYQDRANFIAQELGRITGQEIEIVDGSVQKYSELRDTLQEVIDKKKAEAMLSGYEGAYNEALINRESTKSQVADAANKYKEAQKAAEEVEKTNRDITQMLSSYSDDWYIKAGEWAVNNNVLGKEYKETIKLLKEGKEVDSETVDLLKNELGYLKPQIYETLRDNLTAAKQSEVQALATYKTLADQVTGYSRTIDYYSDLSAAIISGDSEKISTALENLTADFITAENGTKNSLQLQLNDYTQKYEAMKQAVADGAEGITQADVDELKKRKERAQQELDEYVKLHSEKSDTAWQTVEGAKNKANSSWQKLNIEKHTLKEFNGAVSGVEAKTPVMVEKTKRMVTEAQRAAASISLFDSGNNFTQGFIDGMIKGPAFSLVQGSAVKLATSAFSAIADWLGIHSPATKGIYLGENLDLGVAGGIDKGEKKVISSAQTLAQSMYDELNKIDTSAIGVGYSFNKINALATQSQIQPQSKYVKSVVQNSASKIPPITINFGGVTLSSGYDTDRFADDIMSALGSKIAIDGMAWG